MTHFRLIFATLLLSFSVSMAQNSCAPDPCLDSKGNAYVDRLAQAFLTQITAALKKYPPKPFPQPERESSLMLLDALLHDKYAAYRQPVQDFFHERMAKTLLEIENSRVEQGTVIWKLYNMGFIGRTKTVTLAFDLVDCKSTRSDSFALPQKI